MRTYSLSLPLLSLIIGTRTMIGCGLAFLLSEKLEVPSRHAIGWTLLGIGVFTTIPLSMMVLHSADPLYSDAHLHDTLDEDEHLHDIHLRS